MKSTSLDAGFVNRTADGSRLTAESVADAEALLDTLSFEEAYDLVSDFMRLSIDDGKTGEAIALLSEIASHDDKGDNPLKHAAIMQVVAAALIETGDIDGALSRIADTLRLLSENLDIKNLAFKSVLALSLYDLALVHFARDEYHAAERTIDKAIKLIDALAKNNPGRYASSHVHALAAATSIYRSRIKQINLLAHYQVATSTYLSMAGSGAPEAVSKLVDSLVKEAETLLKLGKPRDAVRYLSRALKYLDKIDSEFTLRKLRVSVMLGDALINTFTTRQKGVHLLNTLLQRAKKMDAVGEVERIEHLLDEKTTSLIDILSRWHKLFSRN